MLLASSENTSIDHSRLNLLTLACARPLFTLELYTLKPDQNFAQFSLAHCFGNLSVCPRVQSLLFPFASGHLKLFPFSESFMDTRLVRDRRGELSLEVGTYGYCFHCHWGNPRGKTYPWVPTGKKLGSRVAWFPQFTTHGYTLCCGK